MFAHRLALAKGMTVDEVLARHDSRDLAELQAFDRLNPIDATRRIEVAIGIATAAIVAALGGEGKRASDFMVDYGKAYRDRAEVEQADEAARANPAAVAADVDAVFAQLMGA